MDQKEIAMNGAGVAELGFPMWPQFDPKTKQDMADAMDSGLVSYWTGKKGMEFEEKFRQWSGATMAVSCSCGTAALHIGISCLGIGPGNEVLVVVFLHRVLLCHRAGRCDPRFLRRDPRPHH